jgi:hypothetical protein
MTETNAPARYSNGRFGPGNPGRPVGSRNRASNRIARNILRHFEANQDTFLKDLTYGAYRALYVRLLCHLLPKAAEVESLDVADCNEEEAWLLLRRVRKAVERIDSGEGELDELEVALLGHHAKPAASDDEALEETEAELA